MYALMYGASAYMLYKIMSLIFSDEEPPDED